ncbi:MAG TPA: glutamine amidotransferase [Novosphingobium sp.]|nr:glutamine amidotransferase [Novosphingobium sp.]
MAAKTALIIRHVPVEGVAGFRAPIEDAGFEITRIDVADPVFSTLDLREPDLVIMMGGPMGVYEQDEHPWIACQLRRLRSRLDDGRPTLGVCFGAQMIAAALGAEVYKGPVTEIGFDPVVIHDGALHGPLRHLVDVPVLHWHGDTFTLPPGVELLASSRAYRHQAFRRGNNVLALQFHAEMGLDPRFDEWVDLWPDAIGQAGTDADSLRAAHAAHGETAVSGGRAMIAEWLNGLEP